MKSTEKMQFYKKKIFRCAESIQLHSWNHVKLHEGNEGDKQEI